MENLSQVIYVEHRYYAKITKTDFHYAFSTGLLSCTLSHSRIFQAITPMVVTCIPFAGLTIGMISNGQFPDLGSLFLVMSFSWIPIINPLMTILFIRAY